MSTKSKYIAMGLLFIVFGFILFVYGVRYGIYQATLLDNALKVQSTAYELSELRSGNLDTLIRLKEDELSIAISDYGRFLEDGVFWIYWPDTEYINDDALIKYLAFAKKYRKQYPHDLSLPEELQRYYDVATEYEADESPD